MVIYPNCQESDLSKRSIFAVFAGWLRAVGAGYRRLKAIIRRFYHWVMALVQSFVKEIGMGASTGSRKD